jgi:hypothetical protein
VFKGKESQAAKADSLKLPGWAWENKGRGDLWVLGHKAGQRAYTPKMVDEAYRAIKPDLARIVRKQGPIARSYVRIHPSKSLRFIERWELAINANPNALTNYKEMSQLTVQLETSFDGDPFLVQISIHPIVAQIQNQFFFRFEQSLNSVVYPLPFL